MGKIELLDLARVAFAPGRHVYGFHVNILNKPDALWQVLEPFGTHKANLLCVATPSVQPSQPFATTFIAADLTDTNISDEELAEEVAKLPDVVSVEVTHEVVKGVVADVKHFPLTVHEMRVVVFGDIVLKPLVTTLKQRLGKVADAVLWHMGYVAGSNVAEYYKNVYGARSPAEHFKLLAARTVALGWGFVEEVKVDEEARSARLVIKDLWECSLSEGSGESGSHFCRGILAGFAGVVFGVEVLVEEVECAAKGDEACTFVMKPRERTL